MNKFEHLQAATRVAIEAGDMQAVLLAFSEFAGFPVSDECLRELFQILSVQASPKGHIDLEAGQGIAR